MGTKYSKKQIAVREFKIVQEEELPRKQRVKLWVTGRHVPWMDLWPSEWRPSNLSSQGRQKQNHMTV